MIVFPPAKINLGLNIVRKRTDGYHDLETVFHAIPLHDGLEIITDASMPEASGPVFTASGLQVDGNPEDNICIRAYHLLKKDFPGLPPVRMHLHKQIPMGAGLGGGSSDGAATLALLNRLGDLRIPAERLMEYALALGSDCPFFLSGKPCFATGRGEILQPVPLDLKGHQLLLVNPGIHVSTAEAFRGIVPAAPLRPVHEIVRQPFESWKKELVNDFEKTIFPLHPEIGAVKEQLYNAGAYYASMTGSGSSVYGIFPGNSDPALSFPASYRVFRLLL
ncbi:MAG: 4-(cytidine 5'-diphospho)-2-C-methyl-D-erythritol kinase [Chitinophagaceae bacterium]|jgi:4-diphosphocytidyl-2-C-methyl-D-erythritol kinase|nr:4-(cytidine 5'-diphospho)-2-C-methyl-D-erythritol kinase [Chitinophagaceae bacterium]